MKSTESKIGNVTAQRPNAQCAGSLSTSKATLFAFSCLLLGAVLSSISAAESKSTGLAFTAAVKNDSAVSEDATNSPVARIALDLQSLQAKIAGATAAMSNAVSSTPAKQAAEVTKLADQIAEVANRDLSDQGESVKEVEKLMTEFNVSIAKARKGSSDPSINPSARGIYGKLLPDLEAELSRLVDARASIAKIRAELQRQAEALKANADAIGFAEHAKRLTLASEVFRATLTEVVKFTENLSLMIQQLSGLPLT